MSDDIDRAQEQEQVNRDLALQAHAAKRGVGQPECRECGAGISTLRQQLGAVRCIDCQHAHEGAKR